MSWDYVIIYLYPIANLLFTTLAISGMISLLALSIQQQIKNKAQRNAMSYTFNLVSAAGIFSVWRYWRHWFFLLFFDQSIPNYLRISFPLLAFYIAWLTFALTVVTWQQGRLRDRILKDLGGD